MMTTSFVIDIQKNFSFKRRIPASIAIRNPLFLLLFFLLFSLSLTHQAQATMRVSFIGNTEVDILAYCELESNHTGATIIIERDGTQVVESAGGTDPKRREVFYRDTAVAMGNTYQYSTCCIFKSSSGSSESCTSGTATVGEVGGTLRQDLEISGGTLVLHKSISLTDGATLSINDAVIERAASSSGARISGQYGGSTPGQGTIRILDSTLSADVGISFITGNNLLSGNVITGSYLDIREETNIMLRGNTFVDLKLDIESNTTSHIVQNTFQNSYIDISDDKGEPTVLIDGNQFTSLESGTAVFVRGGEVTIQANVFTGLDGGNIANGISVTNDADSSSTTIISDNLISGFRNALEHRSSQVTISGNVIKDNSLGFLIMRTAAAAVTDNTFYQNTVGIRFEDGKSLSLNNNCIAANNTGLLSSGDGVIDALNNWWGAASGPQHSADNPSGTGDRIYNRTAGTVSFTPWLTTSNCEDVPSLPEPEPATLHVAVSPGSLPADGQSQAILTISLLDENSQPVANAEITLDAPEFGRLDRLSGSTDAAGKLLVNYTAPAADKLKGEEFVKLNIKYPAAAVSDSTTIDFSFGSLDVWAEPQISPYPSDVAIIPGDSRFPGRYQFTLRDHAGQNYAGETLSISIADASRARLEGGGQSGRQISLTTDDQGRASVDYIYLGSPGFDAPFEDIVSISHSSLSSPVQTKVSVGLNIEIADVNTPQRDSGVFPKTLAMRLLLEDSFRPEMDLRSYLTKLEDISGHNIGVELTTQWLNPPRPEFMDSFQSIFPNYGNDDPPELYQGIGVINHADNKQTQVIVEALNLPREVYGANTLPAIIFEDPGSYWFFVQINPIILSEGSTSSSGYVHGASLPEQGIIFGADVLEEAESVFQSVVCSVKPTNRAQFLAMTILIDNPYSDAIASSTGIKMVVKASGIICDFMQGNYATAAINMASLGADGLEKGYKSGALNISLEQYLKLGKIVRMNEAYSKMDNLNSAHGIFTADRSAQRSNTSSFLKDNWPEDLSLEDYKEVMNATISGQMAADDDLNQWQFFGILNDGAVDMSSADETEYFSHNGVHVYLLPSADESINIKTSSDAEVFRFYRASNNEVYTAEYSFPAADITSQLNFSLLEAELKIDTGADGSIDDSYSPEIKKVDTTWTALEIITNQDTYQAGDTLTISATLENPADALLVDVYFSVTSPTGELYSIPDLSPGHTPLVTNFEMPGHFVLPETTIFSFPVPAGLTGAGQFKIEAFLSYPGTLDAVGGNISSKIISFP